MKIDWALRCAVITVVAATALTGCAGRDSGETGQPRPSSTSSRPASPPSSPSSTPTPTPSAVVQTRIGPLLAPTLALVRTRPGLQFQLEDTIGGEPTLDANGDLSLASPLEALVYVDDADGPRSIVLLDGKAYRNTGGAGEDAWKATTTSKARIEVEELGVHSLLPALGAGVTGLKHVGVVEEAGTSLTHYSFTANTRRTLDAMDLEIDGRTPRTMTGEVWVRSDTGVLIRVHMVIGDFRHEVDLSYGVDATIVAPPL